MPLNSPSKSLGDKWPIFSIVSSVVWLSLCGRPPRRSGSRPSSRSRARALGFAANKTAAWERGSSAIPPNSV
jgi:hypothetical protein